MGYQTFGQYTGSMTPAKYSPRQVYTGLEYSKDLPDDIIVGSPGGVSSTHHHPTGGFYGQGGSRSDVFARQGNPYEAGEYGNLYRKGHRAGVDEDYLRENNPKDYEMMGSADTTEGFQTPVEMLDELPPVKTGGDEGMKWLLIFVLVLVAFISFQFFTRGGRMAMSKYLFDGKISWQHSIIIAIVLAVIFGLLFYLTRGSVLS